MKFTMNTQKKSTGKTLLKLFVCIVLFGALICGILYFVNDGKLFDDNSTVSANDTTSSGDLDNTTDNTDNNTTVTLNKKNLDFDVTKDSDLIIHALFVNYKDKADFNKTTDVKKYDDMFNDNDVTNDVFSVYEYFNQASKGKLNVKANIAFTESELTYSGLFNKTPDYYTEKSIFDDGIKNGEVVVYKGQYHVSMIISSGVANQNSFFWGRTYIDGYNLITMVEDIMDISVLCHEISHVLGLMDLYVSDVTAQFLGQPVVDYDLMGATVLGQYSSINAYSRSTLGWLETSDFNDSKTTEIETISEDGIYILKPSTSQNGTVAYKFGENENEEFYVEYRKPTGTSIDNRLPNNETAGLMIYRINKSTNTNLSSSTSADKLHMYIFRAGAKTDYTNYLFNAGSTFSNFAYSNGETSNIAITNITENANGTLSFAIEMDDGLVLVNSKVVITNRDGLPGLKDVEVYANGVKVATTDSEGKFSVKVAPGTKLTFKKYGYTIADKTITEDYKSSESDYIAATSLNYILKITNKDNLSGVTVIVKNNTTDEVGIRIILKDYTTELKCEINIAVGDSFTVIITKDSIIKTYTVNFKEIGETITIDVKKSDFEENSTDDANKDENNNTNDDDNNDQGTTDNNGGNTTNNNKDNGGIFDGIVDSIGDAWDTIVDGYKKGWDNLFGWI